MLVKEVLAQAAFLLGKENLRLYLENNDKEFTEEEIENFSREEEKLLRCYNIVENEIALDFLPLAAEETVEGTDGKVPYTAFLHNPVSVLSVTDGRGEKLSYTIFPDYLKICVDSAVVTYTYAPQEKLAAEKSDYEGRVSRRLFSYGVACEYCLIEGLYQEAVSWDKKYKDALLCACAKNRPHVVRSRRWV